MKKNRKVKLENIILAGYSKVSCLYLTRAKGKSRQFENLRISRGKSSERWFEIKGREPGIWMQDARFPALRADQISAHIPRGMIPPPMHENQPDFDLLLHDQRAGSSRQITLTLARQSAILLAQYPGQRRFADFPDDRVISGFSIDI